MAAVLCGLVSVTLHAASWSPDGEWLAYSYIGGPENIYLVRPDGSEAHGLVVRGQRDFRPEWAPDGSHLVFTSVVDGVHVIMRVDSDGDGLRVLSTVDEAYGDADYSPDGGRLVFFTDEPRPRELYLRDLTNGAVTQLTDTPDFDEASPRFGPHGRRVVFVGTAKAEGAEGDIWLLDLDSGARRNLTATPEVGEFHPDFAHAGDRVVYIRVAGGAFAVGVRDVESGAERIVAEGNGYAVLDPHFAPDDRSVTFTRTDFAERGPGMPAIVRVSLDDGAETRIVRGRYLSQVASPD